MCSSENVDELHRFLTLEEATPICNRFHGAEWQHGGQVMWSGVPRKLVQAWADRHGMQTLTTAMGPLMIHDHPQCLWSRKTRKGKTSKWWSRYMKGASAMYAYHIAQDEGIVTVLSPPPPDQYNPYGGSNYQTIEEPILKGKLGPKVARIEMVHPTIPGAEEFRYQIWPKDETGSWYENFGHPTPETHWRAVIAKQALL
ncbi:hypothetical protein ASPWEDRAFT_44372 [Aspergillus wentii DTO 134E9]|uniref:Uncharacterized protein n=1 Tax=Aspergillus wentii DTO 134E9 TaxID=1073089 RepID=A0A1L9RBJ6_ASPWE|nr:uncharacterized protein ASPWEDRAFT_44372 [Aspergillus wentii DTO 134E9]KAI9934846.1 hypothetical protein MW887_000466 [Aspergillus wentii]OJJ32280.1 hypothetical protein ASPWEDRAFT_44372 [Aspergillus wentii DTO 134E9]